MIQQPTLPPDMLHDRLMQVNVGILVLLDERMRLRNQLLEWRLKHQKNELEELEISTEELLQQVKKIEPELRLPDEKILQLWGKVVEVTGSGYNPSGE